MQSVIYLLLGIALISTLFFKAAMTKKICLIIIVSLFLINGIVAFIGLFFSWNRPIAFNSEGITQKQLNKRVRFKWAEAVEFKVLPRFVLKFGAKHIWISRIVICFLDGSKIVFQPSPKVVQAIKETCSDEPFIHGFKHALLPWGIELKDEKQSH